MQDEIKHSPPQRTGTIRDLFIQDDGVRVVTSLAEFISLVHEISEEWQKDDWRSRAQDDEYLLNNCRLVGQAWFRGHQSADQSLQPGLYREATRENLSKPTESHSPKEHIEDHLLKEL